MTRSFQLLGLCAVTLALPIEISSGHALLRRDANTVGSDIVKPNDKYLLEIKIGSNGEALYPIADSGSLEAWLPNTDDWADLSLSLVNLGIDYQTTYANTAVKGYYAKDTLEIGSSVLNDFIFGVVNNPQDAGTNSGGVFGLGKRKNLAYDTLPYALKAAGKIDKTVASIYYRNSVNRGKLTFGGYDQAKLGSTWQLFSSPGQYWQLPIEKMTIADAEILSDDSTKFIIDSGAEISYFPRAFLDKLAPLFNAERQDNGYYLMSCDQPNDKTFLISVGDITFDVPFNQFKWIIEGFDECYLGAGDSSVFGMNIFGNTVLSSVYTLFDYDAQEVKLANLNDVDKEYIIAA